METEVDWDEMVADIVAHFSTGEYASSVEITNAELGIRAIVTVFSEVVQVSLYNMIGRKIAMRPFFVKTITYADPDAFDGSITAEIEKAIHALPPLPFGDCVENIEIR